ncbi:MAG: phosphatase PAP2 family protein [Pseudonocardiales bacterium]|nr:phosphatase PAP2 family protein [Pseudonocardiales bacterium]
MTPDPSTYRPLLAPRVRPVALVLLMLVISMIVMLAVRYADQDMPGHLDRSLDALIRSHLRPDQPLTQALVSLGNPPEAALLVVAVAGAAAAVRRWSGVLLTIGGTVTAVISTELILKPLVGRLRYGHLSFPSGHTTAVAAVACAAAILLGGARWPRHLALRVAAGLVPVALAGSVAISLVAQHIHYTTDTVAGYGVALAAVLAVALVLDYVVPRCTGAWSTLARSPRAGGGNRLAAGSGAVHGNAQPAASRHIRRPGS